MSLNFGPTDGAGALNTLGAASPAAGIFAQHHAYFVKEWVEIANPELIFDMFGTMKPIPANSGNEITYSKLLKLPTTGQAGLQGSPLLEGTVPTEQQFQMVRFSQTINQYGGFARVTDRLHEESINGVTSMFNQRMAEQGAETMNLVIRDDLYGGSNVRRTGGASDINDIVEAGIGLATADLDYMYQAFKLEKVKPLAPMTTGSPNTGTLPIRHAYPVLVPVEAIPFIEALDDSNGNTFQSIEKYAGQVATWPSEHGSYKHFRFILNTELAIVNNDVSAGSVDVGGNDQQIARCLCFGKGAYHVSTIANSDVELFIKPKGSAGTADPIDQFSSIGWKAKKGATIVQPTYMFRLEFSLGNV